jgi:putative DNA primase/helicase
LGKSQLTNYLAAQVSTGGAWPNNEGSAPEGDVIILSCEDDLADTIRPRLEASRANLTRVHVIEAILADDGKRRGFRLTDDIARLELALQALQGSARLVIIDPITAYMGKTDSHKVADVRAVLAPVQDLAAQYGVAVIAVSHTNKSGGNGKAVNAVTGSQAYVGVSRATWIVTKDDEDESRRLLLQVKNNLGTAHGLAFRVMVAQVPTGEAPCIVFDPGYVEKTADEVLNDRAEPTLGRNQMDKAKAFLQQELANGYVDAATLVARAGHHSITERTLQRAADKIGILKRKNGFSGGWEWGFAMSPNAVAAMFAPLFNPPPDQS